MFKMLLRCVQFHSVDKFHLKSHKMLAYFVMFLQPMSKHRNVSVAYLLP